MSTQTANRPTKAATPAHTSSTPKAAVADKNGRKVRLDLPALTTAYKRAAVAGEGSRTKAYDAAVRAMSVVPSTKQVKGADVNLTIEERAREVAAAFGIGTDGGVFKMRAPRIAQIHRNYTAQGKAGIDPFTKEGHALFTKFENVRRYDADALDTVANAIKAKPEDTNVILDKAIEEAKAKAKARKDANKAAKTAKGGLKELTATFGDMLPMVRDSVAKATAAEKAEARRALEAMLAHLK